MSNTPSDAQLQEVIREAARGSAIKRDGSTSLRIARAVLAKWGAPQPVVREPQPMPDITQLTERGAEAWAGMDAQALRAGREPLTEDQRSDIATAAAGFNWTDDYVEAIDYVIDGVEAAHGITQNGGSDAE